VAVVPSCVAIPDGSTRLLGHVPHRSLTLLNCRRKSADVGKTHASGCGYDGHEKNAGLTLVICVHENNGVELTLTTGLLLIDDTFFY
jgi:hypothetical protein